MRDPSMTMEISQKIRLGLARKAADLIAPEEGLPETKPMTIPACGHCQTGASFRPRCRRRRMLHRGGLRFPAGHYCDCTRAA
jgi:hypothetical protein